MAKGQAPVMRPVSPSGSQDRGRGVRRRCLDAGHAESAAADDEFRSSRPWTEPRGFVAAVASPPVPAMLMVVGTRSMIWEQDALDLQAGYRESGAGCSVVVPNNVPHPLGEVENFIAVDNFVRRVARQQARDLPVSMNP